MYLKLNFKKIPKTKTTFPLTKTVSTSNDKFRIKNK